MAHDLTSDTLVIATHNRGKVAEIADLVSGFGLSVRSAGDLGLPEPEETGTTFEENALLKAKAAAIATGMPSLADDSGICVDALDGAPGVYTADWATKPEGGRDFLMAMRKVEDALQEKGAVSPARRKARFVAVLCLCWPDGEAEFYRGEVTGTLVWPPRGDRGFGYDPVFRPDGCEETFGQMDPDGKKKLSHRARAFAAFARARLDG